MALDVGSRTIGIAVTDELGVLPRPVETLQRRQLTSDAERLSRRIRDLEVVELIVGLPSHLDGRPSTTMRFIEPLVEELQNRLAIPVKWYDERLSTREAEELMSQARVPVRLRRQRRNEFAAAVILRWYLESREGGPV